MARWIPLLALTLVGCGKKDDTGTEDGPVWEDAFDTSSAGSLSGVWGTGPDDIFVVGGTEAGGEVYHYDGAEWSPMTVPAETGLLVWSYGFGPDDVYSVGFDGSVIHWDGSAWTALDSGTTKPLWGVWGTSGSDLWIVGGEIDVEAPTILRYDGSTFTPVPLHPDENSRNAHSLFKVWGMGGTVFALGQEGLMIQWDGTAWKEVGAGPQADQDFVSLWGTAEDQMVAVGGRANARIATWDGSAWTTQAPSGVGGLNAVFMDDPDTAMVGGVNGFVGTFDVASGEVTAEQATDSLDVHAMWGDGAGRTYAVGGSFLDGSHQGLAMVRTVP